MTTFPNAPKLVKGGIVLLDPESGAILRVITLQYNPDTMNRTLQIQPFTGGTGGDPNRSEALRLKGPPVETFKLDAEIDATDQLEIADGVARARRRASAARGARDHRLSHERAAAGEQCPRRGRARSRSRRCRCR